MSIDELQASLMVHEQKLNKKRGEDQALKATSQEIRGKGRGSNRGRGRGIGKQSQPRETVECYKCHKIGHYQNECPEWEKETTANYTQLNNEEEELMLLITKKDEIEERNRDVWYVTQEELMLLMVKTDGKEDDKEEAWYLDSSSSNHMCGNKKNFINLDEHFKQSVKLGNDSKLEVAGKGSVNVRINGVILIISIVYYIPDLKNNLISIGHLQEKGLTVLFKGGQGCCRIYHEEKGLVLESKMALNRMYKVIGKNLINKTTTAEAQCFHIYDELGEKAGEIVYKQLIGSLFYITTTHPDMMYAVSLLSRFMSHPTQKHMLAAKRVLRYLQGTTQLEIKYKKGVKQQLIGFTDSDYAGDIEDRKSTSGYTFLLGEGAVAWNSKK